MEHQGRRDQRLNESDCNCQQDEHNACNPQSRPHPARHVSRFDDLLDSQPTHRLHQPSTRQSQVSGQIRNASRIDHHPEANVEERPGEEQDGSDVLQDHEVIVPFCPTLRHGEARSNVIGTTKCLPASLSLVASTEVGLPAGLLDTQNPGAAGPVFLPAMPEESVERNACPAACSSSPELNPRSHWSLPL